MCGADLSDLPVETSEEKELAKKIKKDDSAAIAKKDTGKRVA